MTEQARGFTTHTLQLFLVLGTLGCEREEPSPSQTPVQAVTPSVSPAFASVAAAAPASGESRLLYIGAHRSPEHGSYLADSSGRPLYMLEQDPRGRTSCYEGCLRIWLPFLAGQGTPSAADSVVEQKLLGTLRREDGGVQVAYNDRALYYYVADGAPGETLGHHVEDSWGEWYLMGTEGRPAEGSPWQRKKK